MTTDDRLVPPIPDDATLVACPCCRHRTLRERANFEICMECGWEDDGQDDKDAHIVRGGPNGSLSLAQARREHLAFLEETADTTDPASVAHGGEGLWCAAAQEHLREQPE
ncbi:CPCC family cysteine-rich protein [Streptomyces sp. LZ34]